MFDGNQMPHGKTKPFLIIAILSAVLWIPEALSQPTNAQDNKSQWNIAPSYTVTGVYSISPQDFQYTTFDTNHSSEMKEGGFLENIIRPAADILLALATIVLACFTISLARSTKRLVEYAAIQAKDMKKSVAAMEKSAYETEALATAAKASADLAREEFNATHRPRIRIRHIFIDPLQPDRRVPARIEASNVGESGAIIVNIGVDIFPRPKHDRRSARFDARPNSVHLSPINPGQQANIDVLGQILSGNTIRAINLGASGTVDLCLLCIIQYQSPTGGGLYATSFFRIYDAQNEHFVRASKDDVYSDWEYED